MQIDADLVEHHLPHDALAKLSGVFLNVGEKRCVLQPDGVELSPEILELLVQLQCPGKGLVRDGLVAVNDLASQDRDLVHELEWCEVLAVAHVRQREIAVAVEDTVGKTEKER